MSFASNFTPPDWFPRLRFTDVFAFGAERLMSHHAALWMISYADQVIISGRPLKEGIAELLYTSGVGKHTSVVYISKRVVDGQGREILVGKVTDDKGRVILNKKVVDDVGREIPKEPVTGMEVFSVSQYIWEHEFHRPNGFSFPLTCPLCHCVASWQNIPSCSVGDGSPFNVVCKTKLGNGQKCRGIWEVPARLGSSAVDYPYGGTWRKV